MARNQVQFQKGMSLAGFFARYGTEEQCRKALFQWRWPDGFVCPACGQHRYDTLHTRKLYQCRACRHQTSLTAGTIFQSTRLPLTTWFLGMYLVTQSKTGVSALALRRYLGITYNAAWRMKHKLMQVMKERDDSQPLTGVIQLDDAYWGGEHHGGKRGRGSPNKVPFIAAVATNEACHPIAMRMTRVDGFRTRTVENWARTHLDRSSTVISDGLACFRGFAKAGHAHQAIVTGGGAASMRHTELVWINTMIGNIKTALHGTYHAINKRHLPRYLAEFCYRFNRRFQLEDLLPRLAYAAVRTPPMPQRLLSLAEPWG